MTLQFENHEIQVDRRELRREGTVIHVELKYSTCWSISCAIETAS